MLLFCVSIPSRFGMHPYCRCHTYRVVHLKFGWKMLFACWRTVFWSYWWQSYTKSRGRGILLLGRLLYLCRRRPGWLLPVRWMLGILSVVAKRRLQIAGHQHTLRCHQRATWYVSLTQASPHL